MEINKDIAAKMLNLYLGHKGISVENGVVTLYSVKLPEFSPREEEFHLSTYHDHLGHNEEMIEGFKLLLTPINKIIDEHVVEIACSDEKKKNGFSVVKINRYDTLVTVDFRWISEKVNNADGFSYSSNGFSTGNFNISIKTYQRLIELGYDTPHNLLGGRTLQEVGLATYKH